MQTLGISESTPKGENRLKSLLWPSVHCGEDVDYLGTQGYLICSLVAAMSAFVGYVSGQPVFALFYFIFFYFGGVGVRERSLFAAIMVFALYLLETIADGIGIVKIIFTALLFANVRATWAAANWNPRSEEAAMPPRLGDTFFDKFTDRFPAWLWPKIRFAYYAFSFVFLGLIVVGLLMQFFFPAELTSAE